MTEMLGISSFDLFQESLIRIETRKWLLIWQLTSGTFILSIRVILGQFCCRASEKGTLNKTQVWFGFPDADEFTGVVI